MVSHQSIAAMLPVVMPPIWVGMVVRRATAKENAHAETA